MKLIFTISAILFVTVFSFAGSKSAKSYVESASLPSLGQWQFAIYNGRTYEVVEFFEFENQMLSKNCTLKKLIPGCQAALAYKKVSEDGAKAFGGNPASAICSVAGGSNFIGLNSKNNEYNFCKFLDGSFVNSWSLVDKVNQNMKVK